MDEGNSRIQETVEPQVSENKGFWQSSWFVAILLGLLCVISYWNSLDGNFQYDDHRLVRFNLALRETNWKEIIRTEPSRPLSIISFALNFQANKTDTRSYHAVNIALHFISVFVFYLFLRRMKPDGWFAIVAAVLMAIHPLNTESVSYISGRSIVLCAVFYILAMLSFDSHLRKPSWRAATGFIVFFILAGLSKENAAAIPLVILLYAFLFYGKESLNQSRISILIVFLLTLVAGLYRFFAVPDIRAEAYPALTYWTTELNVWVRYLWLSFYPLQLNVDHDVAPLNITNPWFLGALVLVVGLCYLLWKIRKTHPVLTFWGIWFFLNLLPSSIIPLHEFMAEHLTYISMFGFCACISYGLMVVMKPFVKPAPLLWVVLIVICSLSVYGTIHRNKVWQDGISLWTDAAAKSPQRIRPHLNLAEAYIQQKSLDKAIDEYSLALSHNPRLKEAFSGIGIAYLRMGAVYWAKQYFQKALAQDPNFTDARIGMGLVMYEDGDCQETLRYLAPLYGERWESSEVVSRISDCHVQLGNASAAVPLLKRSVDSGTSDGRLYAALMEVYFLEKRYPEALQVYDQYKDRFPPLALTQLRVGTMLKEMGRVENARTVLLAVSKDPKYGRIAREALKQMETSSTPPVQNP